MWLRVYLMKTPATFDCAPLACSVNVCTSGPSVVFSNCKATQLVTAFQSLGFPSAESKWRDFSGAAFNKTLRHTFATVFQ